MLIYHEPTLPVGAVHYMTKGRTDGNADLHKLASELKTEEFPRIAVGVQYPDPTMRYISLLCPLSPPPSPLPSFSSLFLSLLPCCIKIPHSRFAPPVLHQLQSLRPNYSEYFLLNKFPKSHWVQLHEVCNPSHCCL